MPAIASSSNTARLGALVAVLLLLFVYTYEIAGGLQQETRSQQAAIADREKLLGKILELKRINMRFQYDLARLKNLNPRTRSLSSRIEALAKGEGYADKLAGMFKRTGKQFDGIVGQESVEITFQRLSMEEIVKILKSLEAPSSGMKVEMADVRLLGQRMVLLRLEVSALTFG